MMHMGFGLPEDEVMLQYKVFPDGRKKEIDEKRMLKSLSVP